MSEHLEEQYARHPYDEACSCKLCDWRRPREAPREDHFAEQMRRNQLASRARPLGLGNGDRRWAAKQMILARPIDSQEALQEAWNRPVTVRLSETRIALLVLVVVCDEGDFSWHASARIKHHRKPKLKATSTWTPEEKRKVAGLLDEALDGCGHRGDNDPAASAQESTWALHINRPVTAEERDVILRPRILGGPGETGP